MTVDLLADILSSNPPPFALLHRPHSKPRHVDALVGEVSAHHTLADLPVSATPAQAGSTSQDSLVLIPFRQISERGYDCVDDREPLIALRARRQATYSLATVMQRIPPVEITLSEGGFDVGDREYADTVRRVISEEIGQGVGSNFVIKRSFLADITDYTAATSLAFFRRLVERESGAYWTFVVHTGERTLVGASPERHISLADGTATMNPVSGTYRYPSSGPVLEEVLEFLSDRKETDELYMVVDEELKMMSRICRTGIRVRGPYLKEMSKLAHTEYLIEGTSQLDVRDILRQTLFAPTVTGSPLQSAPGVISRHEANGRGYYSGVAALIGHDENGGRTLDSAILIRTADIDARGRMSIGAGATLVRHSDPDAEADETRAKVSGLLSALGAKEASGFARHPQVRRALEERNATIARYWLNSDPGTRMRTTDLAGLRVLVVDAEDSFTSMLEQQLQSLGASVTVRPASDAPVIETILDRYDLTIMGPGPGDPLDQHDPKIAALTRLVRHLLAQHRPFLAVCLSHQVLSLVLGLAVVRKPVPNQGLQKQIDLFGHPVRVGFYNTFSARCDSDIVSTAAGTVEVSRDPHTAEVHALRGHRFSSLQFHSESVLTEHSLDILSRTLERLLSPQQDPSILATG